MSANLQVANLLQVIRSWFKCGTSKANEETIEDEKGAEDLKSLGLSAIQKLVYAVKRWDPFPLRAHEVDDVNEVNKQLLLAVISFLLCTSFVLVWISAFVIDARRSHDHASTDSFSSHALSLSAIVLVISLVAFGFTLCGFVGVFRENIILIRIFYISLIVMLSLKLSIALFIFAFTGASESMIGSLLGDKLVSNYRASTDIEATMDYLQIKFRCCGLREQGFQDWNTSTYFQCFDDNPSTERCGVPWSCCRNGTGSENALCGANVQNVDRNIASQTIYTKGCIIAIMEWASSRAFLLAFLLLLETLLLTMMIFQCTHLVNELQMMTGAYRGPWWIWIGEPSPKHPSNISQRAGYRRERPVAALPFHLELAWHESSTSDAQYWDAEEPFSSGQQTHRQAQQEASDPRANARYEHRRSTIGQRFFRAVISRASRLVNRRQAVAMTTVGQGEKESQKSAAAPYQQNRTSWVVHHRPRDVGSVGPAAAASHRLEPLQERETEPVGASNFQRSPLPPIGESAVAHSTSAEEEPSVEAEPVEELAPAGDQRPSEASIGTGELFEKRNVSIAGDIAFTPNKRSTDRKDVNTLQTQLPGLIVPQTPVDLPKVHSVATKKLGATVQPTNSLAISRNESKAPANSRIALVLNAVNKDEDSSDAIPAPAVSESLMDVAQEPLDSPARATETAAPPQPAVTAPAEPSPAETVRPASTIQPRPLVAEVPGASPAAELGSPETKATPVAAVVSPSREIMPDVGPSETDAEDVRNREDSVQHSEADGDVVRHEAADDDTAIADAVPEEKTSEGPTARSVPGHESQQRVLESSTDTYSEKKDKKSHHRKSKPHKKKKHKKKKEHMSPVQTEDEETDSAQPEPGPSAKTERDSSATPEPGSSAKPDPGSIAKPEPVPDWLMSSPQKAADAPATGTRAGSAYFSPSEFKNLAVSQKADPEAGLAPERRKGTIASAISKKLHEIMPSFNPVPTSHTPKTLSADNDEHVSLARTMSRKLHDIMPSFGFHSGGAAQGPAEPKEPGRLPSPGLEAASPELFRRPSTSRGSGPQGPGSRSTSSAWRPNVDSEGQW